MLKIEMFMQHVLFKQTTHTMEGYYELYKRLICFYTY